LSRSRPDDWSALFFAATAAAAGVILLSIVALLIMESLPLLQPHTLLQAISTTEWRPQDETYGLLAMLTASLTVSFLALMLAGPLGVLYALWLNLYLPPKPAALLRALLELLAGVPSVVYGLWGIMVLVPLINRHAPPGSSFFAAVLVLALLILPFSGLISDAALRSAVHRRMPAARALAVSRWGAFLHILWPETRNRITGGLVLQFGRALGETMAVLMVAGNVVQFPDSLFDPVRTLTANIALEMGYASGRHQSALFLSGLILLCVTLLLMLFVNRRSVSA